MKSLLILKILLKKRMQFNKNDKILVVAAHPDDEVLGCGGNISSLAKKGIKIRVVFLSEGVSSRYDRDVVNETINKEIKLRQSNAYKSLKVLDIKKTNIFFENLFKKFHLLKLFFVILPFTSSKGIFFSLI